MNLRLQSVYWSLLLKWTVIFQESYSINKHIFRDVLWHLLQFSYISFWLNCRGWYYSVPVQWLWTGVGLGSAGRAVVAALPPGANRLLQRWQCLCRHSSAPVYLFINVPAKCSCSICRSDFMRFETYSDVSPVIPLTRTLPQLSLMI